MALRDYRYTGFDDENSITEILLYSMPKIVKARKERARYLESRAMQGASMSTEERVQGGEETPKAQNYLERKERDKILTWLSTIERRIGDKVKNLSKVEKDFIREYYFSGRIIPMPAVAERIGVESKVASQLRFRVMGKLRRSCTSVYHLFCMWREQDDREMEERRSELDDIIG